MNILIAPNSMKGSLSAFRFAEIVEKAFSDTNPGFFNTRQIPVADGGDETAEVLIRSIGLKKYETIVKDPLGRDISATFGYANGIAVIEMANVSGMKLLKKEELNPFKTSSFGTGQLILEAIKLGARKILLGVGGSATVDGGMGMLEALGVKFYNLEGKYLSGIGGNLIHLYSIDITGLIIPKEPEIKIISDVENPLLGKNGAARVFAPQKGATPEMVKLLEKGLANFEEKIRGKTNISTAGLKGSGAAGGLAIGLVALLNAKIVMGADFILNILEFDKHVKWADVVITGEGKFDRQSLNNKAPYAVALHAKKYGKPVYAIVGSNEYQNQSIFKKVYSLVDQNIKVDYAIQNAEKLVYEKAKELADILFKT